MAKPTQLEKLAVRAAAQRIAASEGRSWKDLPEEDRSAKKRDSANKITDADREAATALLAKRKKKKKA